MTSRFTWVFPPRLLEGLRFIYIHGQADWPVVDAPEMLLLSPRQALLGPVTVPTATRQTPRCKVRCTDHWVLIREPSGVSKKLSYGLINVWDSRGPWTRVLIGCWKQFFWMCVYTLFMPTEVYFVYHSLILKACEIVPLFCGFALHGVGPQRSENRRTSLCLMVRRSMCQDVCVLPLTHLMVWAFIFLHHHKKKGEILWVILRERERSHWCNFYYNMLL